MVQGLRVEVVRVFLCLFGSGLVLAIPSLFIFGWYGLLSFEIGHWMANAVVLVFVSAFALIRYKKFVALGVSLIVLKYPILTGLVYLTLSYKNLDLVAFVIGIASMGLGFFSYALWCAYREKLEAKD